MGVAIAANARVIAGREPLAEGPTTEPPAAVDRSELLIRREAEAARRRREQVFEKLRRLPPAPVDPNLIIRRNQVRLDAVQMALARRVFARLEPEPAEDQDDADELGQPMNGQRPPGPRFLVPSSYFDDLIFGNRKEGDVRDRLLAVLKQRIKYLKDGYALSPAQEQKLLLAGKGDLKRLFDEVEDARSLFEQARTDEDRLRAFLQDVAMLRFRLSANLFDGQSLFTKAFLKMRSEKQLVRKPQR
jgi:hypothetical protein